jgi:hypothetical protein
MPGLKWPLIAVFMLPICTVAMYLAARDSSAGHDFDGRHQALKQLLYSVGNQLGATGSLVVGGGLTLGAVAWLVGTIRRRRAFQGQTAEANSE